MKLQSLLESFNPRSLLLHVQQLVLDKHPEADVEINSHVRDSFTLKIIYADLKPIFFELWRDSHGAGWMTEFKSGSGNLPPSSLRIESETAFNVAAALEALINASFVDAVNFTDDMSSSDENWVIGELEKLVKYLDNGRLKKASDVHVLISKDDDESVQSLETRYNSTIVNYKKLKSVIDRSIFIFILANLD